MPAIYIPGNFIQVFDFKLQFDLTDGTIKIDLSPSIIINPGALTFKGTIIAPDGTISDLGTIFANQAQPVVWPLPRIMSVYMWGLYTVQVSVTINGTDTYTNQKNFNLCAPNSQNPYTTTLTGTIVLTVDCNAGQLMASGFCGYAYQGQPPIKEVYNLVRYYPPEAELLPLKNLTVLPFLVDAYVGVNMVKGSNTMTYDFGDNILAILLATAEAQKNIRCGMDMEQIYCGMKAKLDSMEACGATPQDYACAFGEIDALLWLIMAGINMNNDMSDYITRLEKMLGVECVTEACAGQKVGPKIISDCPQMADVSAIIDTANNKLIVSYDDSTIPGGTVHIRYRTFCDPSASTAWNDGGYHGYTGGVVTLQYDIPSPTDYQVELSSSDAAGGNCPPLTILARGNCPSVVDMNQPPPPKAVVTYQLDYGWSPTAFASPPPSTFVFQGHQQVTLGATSFTIDYSAAPANTSYLILRYPSSETEKTKWFNTALNSGTIVPPDQVFQDYKNTTDHYTYVWSRVQPVLQSTNKTIIFSN